MLDRYTLADLGGRRIWMMPRRERLEALPAATAWIIPSASGSQDEGEPSLDPQAREEAEGHARLLREAGRQAWFAASRAPFEALGLMYFPLQIDLDVEGRVRRPGIVVLPAGSRVVCVAAVNVGRGRPFQLLGCARLEVESPDPVGVLERAELTTAGDVLRIGGWALDPENPFPLPMTVTIDGVEADHLVAGDDRSDLTDSFPGKGTLHGFDGEVHIDPGTHDVCVRAQNLGRGADRWAAGRPMQEGDRRECAEPRTDRREGDINPVFGIADHRIG